MRASFPWRPAPSDENPVVEPLKAENVGDLRLPWHSRFSADSLSNHLLAEPVMSLWVPATGEYAVGERWRRRDDIAQILEVSARKGRGSLVRRLIELFRVDGYSLALCTDDVWRDGEKVYAALGFRRIERIVFFRRELPSPGWTVGSVSEGELRFEQVGLESISRLMPLDHSSFPWLWWNSLLDMQGYIGMEGVHVYGASLDGVPVGYASFTTYNGWAHLDRLAVVEARQGRGFGAAQLNHVLRLMSEWGAASVSLSTQQANTRSHSLYKGFGFRQTPEAMDLYGLYLAGTPADTVT